MTYTSTAERAAYLLSAPDKVVRWSDCSLNFTAIAAISPRGLIANNFSNGSAMRIGASSILGTPISNSLFLRRDGSPAASALLIRKFAKGVSVSDTLASSDGSRSADSEPELNRDSALNRIELLLEAIQNSALQGSTGSNRAGDAESAIRQRAIDEALQAIGGLIGTPIRLGGRERAVVSGLNPRQIERYEILSLRPNATLTLSGSVRVARKSAMANIASNVGGLGRLIISTNVNGLDANQIATLNTGFLQPGVDITVSGSLDVAPAPAELVYEGAPGASVTGTASFRLSGPKGSTNVAITSGEALSEVAERINGQSGSTGVVASIQGNSLVLSTLATGASASLIVDSVDRERNVSVSGVNGTQVDDFQVVSIPDETQVTLSGNVSQAATRATRSPIWVAPVASLSIPRRSR